MKIIFIMTPYGFFLDDKEFTFGKKTPDGLEHLGTDEDNETVLGDVLELCKYLFHPVLVVFGRKVVFVDGVIFFGVVGWVGKGEVDTFVRQRLQEFGGITEDDIVEISFG